MVLIKTLRFVHKKFIIFCENNFRPEEQIPERRTLSEKTNPGQQAGICFQDIDLSGLRKISEAF